jgi:hypothetical protein
MQHVRATSHQSTSQSPKSIIIPFYNYQAEDDITMIRLLQLIALLGWQSQLGASLVGMSYGQSDEFGVLALVVSNFDVSCASDGMLAQRESLFYAWNSKQAFINALDGVRW